MSEKIQKCFAIEMAVAEIYRSFGGMFPEGKELWEKLAAEEENHAKFVVAGDFLKVIGKGPGKVTLPDTAFLGKMAAYLDGVGEQINAGGLSFVKAVSITLTIEESMVEGYLFDIEGGGDGGVVMDLKRMLIDEKAHLDTVREYMIEKGLSRVS